MNGRDRSSGGLVNGHIALRRGLFKGRYGQHAARALDAYCYPILGATPPPIVIYLPVDGGGDGLGIVRNGVTTWVDDVYELGGQ